MAVRRLTFLLAALCVASVVGNDEICELMGVSTEEEALALCTPRQGAMPCSGHGECHCGYCSCHGWEKGVGYYGQYCECNRRSCSYYEGQLCGGPDHGICECSECRCKPGWEGEACSVSTATDRCVDSTGGLCNGKGVCVHNTCMCTDVYRGPTCEENPFSPGRCQQLKQCVQCRLLGEDCPSRPCSQDIHVVDELPLGDNWRLCQFRSKEDFFSFTYSVDPGEQRVLAKMERA